MSTLALRPKAASPWRVEIRGCLALGAPLVATNAIETAMGLTNAAMIGRIAPSALAASALAMALYMLCLVFGIGLSAALSSLIARERGRDATDTTVVRHLVQGGLWNAVLVALPISIFLSQGGPILRALGQDPALIGEASTYLHALQGAIVPALVYLTLRSVFAAMERPRWTVAAGVFGVVINAALNWVLIDGRFGLPALGLGGSGLATLCANLVMALVLVLVLAFDPTFKPYRVFAGLLRPPWHACGALWRLGLPIGVAIVLEVGMFAAATGLIGHFDPSALAAHAIALQVASFTFMAPLGLAQAATVRVGQAYGAGDRVGMRRAGWTAFALGIAAMTCSAASFLIVPGPIVGLFLARAEPGSAEVLRMASVLLAIAGLFQIADGAQVVLAGMLRGLQDTRMPALIAAIGYWGVGLPVAAVLGIRLGAPGVWIGLTAGLFAVAGLLLARWWGMAIKAGS